MRIDRDFAIALPKRRRGLWLGLVLLVATAAVVIGLRFSPKQSANMMTATATLGDIEESVLATGILKPVKLVAVGAQASGRITSIKVTLGQTIKAGDLIAEIDSMTQSNSLRTAEANLAYIRAQRKEKEAALVYAKSSLARQTKTVALNASSQADYDSAVSSLDATDAQIAALDAQIKEAEVAIETARVNLGYTRITAPIDGAVLSIVSQEGQTVNAAQSTPTIAILGQLDVMTVRTEISEADVVKVKPGQALYFTILGDPDQRYSSKLESIEPAPESITSDSSFSSSTTAATSSTSSSSSSTSSSAIYYNGIFHVPNANGRLKTYMTAEVHIVLESAKEVLLVPSSALSKANDGIYTVEVVVEDGTTAKRKVVVGLNDKVMAEIRSGLQPGERVVTGTLSDAAASGNGGPPSPMGF